MLCLHNPIHSANAEIDFGRTDFERYGQLCKGYMRTHLLLQRSYNSWASVFSPGM